MPSPKPKKPSSATYQVNPFCGPLREMYARFVAGTAATWNQIEPDFLATMAAFDAALPRIDSQLVAGADKTEVLAALQNGKGDWFNDVVAELLIRCSQVQLHVRRRVPGLIVAENNLDGAFPDAPDPIEFLLEAKMLGLPKHVLSPKQGVVGRRGSADAGKRVKELAFKAVDLKLEAARRLAMAGKPGRGGPLGGDLTKWLRANPPTIYFFMGVRVVDEADFKAILKWARTAGQVVDAVGLYCYEVDPNAPGKYRSRQIPDTEIALDRVLHRACQELRKIAAGPPSVPADVPAGPAVLAKEAERGSD